VPDAQAMLQILLLGWHNDSLNKSNKEGAYQSPFFVEIKPEFNYSQNKYNGDWQNKIKLHH
jgi:hypothetical protein